MEEMKKGKKRWFAVDFKSFEVVVEVVKGCFHGRIVGEEVFLTGLDLLR